MQVQKKYPHPENTQALPLHFFLPPGPKKNPARSKKHVQVQEKGAQVPKTGIPKLFSYLAI